MTHTHQSILISSEYVLTFAKQLCDSSTPNISAERFCCRKRGSLSAFRPGVAPRPSPGTGAILPLSAVLLVSLYKPLICLPHPCLPSICCGQKTLWLHPPRPESKRTTDEANLTSRLRKVYRVSPLGFLTASKSHKR